MVRHVGGGQLGPRLGQDAGDVERHIADADDRRRLGVEVRVEAGEVGMAVVPADEGGRPDHPGLVVAGNTEHLVARHAEGQHHRVVKGPQLLETDVAAELDIAEITYRFGERRALERFRHLPRRLMVGRDAVTDEAERRRQAFDDVDAIIGVRFDQCVRGIEPGGTTSNDGNTDGHYRASNRLMGQPEDY